MKMIKLATIEDVENVTSLAMLLWEGHEASELKEEFEQLIASEQCAVFIFKEKEQAIGFAQCQLRVDYVEGTETSPVGYLEGVFVLEQYRKRGIARDLVQYCEQWATQKGCSEFASDCELENEASAKFHAAMGFIEANRIICFKKKI